jgi:nicotinamidase-related amidase
MARLSFKGRHYRLYPAEKYLGLTEQTFDLDTAYTAFMLVDVCGAAFGKEEKDIEWGGPDLGYVFSGEDDVIVRNVRPALDAARAIKLPIVYVNQAAPNIATCQSAFGRQRHMNVDKHLDELFAESKVDPLEYRYVEGTTFATLAPIIAPKAGDYLIRKWTYSGFFDTRLDTLLKNLHVRHLVVVGFALDFCLMGTVLDALYHNYDVFLLRDCTLACDLPGERDTLAWTRRLILWLENAVGVTTTSREWIAACKGLQVGL